MKVEFRGFNSFMSADGDTRVSFERGFGRVGGAQSWDEFTARGREWIEENYSPERCSLIVLHNGDIDGINADQVRLE